MNNHYAILRRERTEALKAKRRIYGDRGGHLHFSEHKLAPRPDGIANAVTTFEQLSDLARAMMLASMAEREESHADKRKDNYLMIEYE